eukprot:9361158-Pyramimonas_sp.AAC.2
MQEESPSTQAPGPPRLDMDPPSSGDHRHSGLVLHTRPPAWVKAVGPHTKRPLLALFCMDRAWSVERSWYASVAPAALS